MRTPDFERNTLAILQKRMPERATLFDLFLNEAYYKRLAGREPADRSQLEMLRLIVDAFAAAGYDYATADASAFRFNQQAKTQKTTRSLNDAASITDWASFDAYVWNNPEDYSTQALLDIRPHLPEGMKLMVKGPGGVLENTISLMGYDNLCILLFEEPDLVRAVVDHVGDALVRYYEGIAAMDTVGFLCSNDDWGFNTQTFLSPADMRSYIFPWHKRIVEVAHRHGKPCILHSCGYYGDVIEDVICDMRYDGRHSYEDNIVPIETAYEALVGRIAVMGGLDMHFMATDTPEAIRTRATAMLERSHDRGGYFLGTGNSVPEFIPFDNYMAMVKAAWDFA